MDHEKHRFRWFSTIWLSRFQWFSKKNTTVFFFVVVLVVRFSFRHAVFLENNWVQNPQKSTSYLDRCFSVVWYQWYDFWFVCLSGCHVAINSYFFLSSSWIHDHWGHVIGRAELRIGKHLFVSARFYVM